MKVFAYITLSLVAAANAVTLQQPTDHAEFHNWSIKHARNYASEAEFSMRHGIWKYNLERINQFNSENHSYKLGLNAYADLTHDEFHQARNGYVPEMKKSGQNSFGSYYTPEKYERTFEAIPESKDWRDDGMVSKVKNQGQCGSCYSFSATGSIEGQYAKKYGKMVSLSEQEILDCSASEGNMGCNGGLMDNVFQFIMDRGGLESERDYPYEMKKDSCNINKKEFVTSVTGYKDIPSQDEKALTEALATVGPISIAIDASHWTFQFYHSGVYNPYLCSSTALDHGVLAVGYGTDENGGDYYIVKNSWGPSYGLSGYLWMARNNNNKCGVATTASYPIVA